MKQKTQSDRFKETAREFGCDESEERFNERLKRIAKAGRKSDVKVCPECGHVFQGNGWDGVDAHWRAKHEEIMPYEDAWPLLRDGKYQQ